MNDNKENKNTNENENIENHVDDENLKKKRKQSDFELKALNYYHNNSNQIFRYLITFILLFLFIFVVYIVIPTDTKNGVNRNVALRQVNGINDQTEMKNKIDSFGITVISDKYTLEQSKRYTHNIIKFIDEHPNQKIYSKTLNFLISNCSLKLNENTFYLFNVLENKFNNPDFIKNLDENNILLKSNLTLCKNETNNNQISEIDKILEQLKKEKLIVENKITLIQEQRDFDKTIYGDIYDKETGTTRYQEANQSTKRAQQEQKQLMINLEKELELINEKINKIKTK